MIDGCKHEFGTVIIPVETGNGIINKQYLIDCTYSQFFTIAGNVDDINKDESHLDAGYYLESEEEKEFAKKVIEDGYFEVTKDRLQMYMKGLYYSLRPLKDIEKSKRRV